MRAHLGIRPPEPGRMAQFGFGGRRDTVRAMIAPRANRPARSLWRSGVAESHPLTVRDFYRKKFDIGRGEAIATAGSCFAQHVARFLRAPDGTAALPSASSWSGWTGAPAVPC